MDEVDKPDVAPRLAPIKMILRCPFCEERSEFGAFERRDCKSCGWPIPILSFPAEALANVPTFRVTRIRCCDDV